MAQNQINQGIEQAFANAVALHGAGRIVEAEAAYRRVLSLNPCHADALHLLGLARHQLGRASEGIDLIRRAIELSPDNAAYYSNLGVILAGAGQFAEAIAALKRAAALRPDFPEAQNNLGNALKQAGELEQAIEAYRHALSLRNGYPEAHFNLGSALQLRGDLHEAIRAYQSAIALRPTYPDAFNNLGTALQETGQFEQAIQAYRRAIQLAPQNADAHNNLGSTLGLMGKLDEAIAVLRRAIELRPGAAELHSNLASVLRDDDQLDGALASLNTALSLKPDLAHALGTLGGVLKDRGQLDESIAAYRQAVSLSNDAKIADSLLLTLHYHPEYDAKKLYEKHVEWDRRYASQYFGRWAAHANEPAPERPLRIGYVGDLSNSPVGRFLLPLLTGHDRSLYEAYCYADVQRPDQTSLRLAAQAPVWRDVAGLTDEELATQIRADRIDILLDLAMHGGRNRLLTFARKPAPVQVTYLAYASTTGLRAIDYRLTDPYLDPTDDDQPFYSERSLRLPTTYWCYQAPPAAPPVGPLPALEAGIVTFGSMNRSAKITPAALAAWAQLLQQIPNSRLILHWGEGSHRDAARRQLADRSIDPNRLQFVAAIPFEQYLRQYSQFDIALDPFPYPGGTTSCDALWMGVPVVTLAGRTASSRGGLSILTNLGLPELVARTADQYVETAAGLAGDLDRLRQLRSTLRERMRASPLMDAPRFARDVEVAYRLMWRTWCESRRSKLHSSGEG